MKTVIEMAKAAGLFTHKEVQPELERFAELVAAVKREKVAAWMMQQGYATGHGDTVEDLLKELEWQLRESEREACEMAIEELPPDADRGDCAAAIRARGSNAP